MIENKKLNSHELKTMADVMSDAFKNHENFVHLIPKSNQRKKATNNLFMMLFKVANEYGTIFKVIVESEVVGYISYMDDSKESVNLKTVIKTRGLGSFLKFIYYTRFNIFKYIKYMKLYSKKPKPKKGSIHLYTTGIKGVYRGQGIMKKAFLESFDYFRKIGYSIIILETSDQSNIKVYEKIGFKITKTIESEDKSQKLNFFELDL